MVRRWQQLEQKSPHRLPWRRPVTKIVECGRITPDIGAIAICLDTLLRKADGECAVVMIGLDGETGVVAESFLDFLCKVGQGLI